MHSAVLGRPRWCHGGSQHCLTQLHDGKSPAFVRELSWLIPSRPALLDLSAMQAPRSFTMIACFDNDPLLLGVTGPWAAGNNSQAVQVIKHRRVQPCEQHKPPVRMAHVAVEEVDGEIA